MGVTALHNQALIGLMASAVVAFAACGSDAPSPGPDSGGGSPSGDDAAGPGDAAGDATIASSDGSARDAACVVTENDAGTCNAVDVGAPTVTSTCVLSEPPQGQGGPIEDGTYVLQAFVYYGVCPTQPDVSSTTWAICGNHWDVAQASLDPGGNPLPILRLDFTTTVQGASVMYTSSCTPPPGTPFALGPREYTASPGHLMFVYPDATVPGRVFVSTYTRQ